MRRFSRHKDRCPTNVSEIFVFLALVILQGILRKSVLEWYWNKKHSLYTSFCLRMMSYNHFVHLKWFLNFSDSSIYDPATYPNPKLNMIWPTSTHVNKLFSSSITPECDVTVEESFMQY
jgi:hypothetical protein